MNVDPWVVGGPRSEAKDHSRTLILAFLRQAGKCPESLGHIIHDLREERNAAGKRTVIDGYGAWERTRQGRRLAGVPLVGAGGLVEMQGELTVGFGGVGKAGLGPALRTGKDILIALGGPFR
ncbi:hypothetical protein [Azospirillum baldaniorum]|uniref:hypothetical protein n=1 Tax=Azospirillum baldaniorum TaxID=1064539 RepID=UPI00157B6E3E|nr:hypothetical protein [Azospirillum baldaniorum]